MFKQETDFNRQQKCNTDNNTNTISASNQVFSDRRLYGLAAAAAAFKIVQHLRRNKEIKSWFNEYVEACKYKGHSPVSLKFRITKNLVPIHQKQFPNNIFIEIELFTKTNLTKPNYF